MPSRLKETNLLRNSNRSSFNSRLNKKKSSREESKHRVQVQVYSQQQQPVVWEEDCSRQEQAAAWEEDFSHQERAAAWEEGSSHQEEEVFSPQIMPKVNLLFSSILQNHLPPDYLVHHHQLASQHIRLRTKPFIFPQFMKLN